MRYAGIHYASKPLFKQVPLCIHGFVLHFAPIKVNPVGGGGGGSAGKGWGFDKF